MLQLSRAQLREVDRIAIQEYGLPGIVLMENAARSVAGVVDGHYGELMDRPKHGVVVCGGGNNGGDGYAAARLLHNWGWKISIIALVSTSNLRGDALTMAKVAAAMGIPIRRDFAPLQSSMFIVDAITGTGLSRPLEGTMAKAVELINAAGQPIIAVDVPSGLDCDTGEPLGEVCVRARRTVTLVAMKVGFANPESEAFTGEIVIGDIGCPRAAIDHVATLSS